MSCRSLSDKTSSKSKFLLSPSMIFVLLSPPFTSFPSSPCDLSSLACVTVHVSCQDWLISLNTSSLFAIDDAVPPPPPPSTPLCTASMSMAVRE